MSKTSIRLSVLLESALWLTRCARSRIPLYFGESARISQAHANAALKVIFDVEAGKTSRLRALARYANTYRSHYSRLKLVERRNRSRFSEEVVDTFWEKATIFEESLDRNSNGLVKLLEAQHCSSYAESPIVSKFRSSVPLEPRKSQTNKVILVASSDVKAEQLDFLSSDNIDDIAVISTRWEDSRALAVRVDRIFPRKSVSVAADIADMATRWGPVSTQANHAASVMADRYGAAIADRLPEQGWPSYDDSFRTVLGEHISDVLYQSIQSVTLLRAALRDSDPYRSQFCAVESYLPALAVARVGAEPLVPIWLDLVPPPRPEKSALQDSLNRKRRRLSRALRKRLPQSTISRPVFLFSMSSRMEIYNNSVTDIAEAAATADCAFLDFDSTAPRNPDSLQSVLSFAEFPKDADAADAVIRAAIDALEDCPELVPLFSILRPQLEAVTPYLMGLHALRLESEKALLALTSAVVIGCPARESGFRTLDLAAKAAGHATADLQVLLTGASGRYRSPVADMCLLTDRYTAEDYATDFAVASSRISIVGSLMADRELADIVPSGSRGTFNILLAAQPLSQHAMESWFDELGRYCHTRSNTRVTLRAHPAQDATRRAWMLDRLRRAAGSTQVVISSAPRVGGDLADANVLVTFYSNVALLAGALGIPALALDHPVRGRIVDFDRRGAAHHIASKEALHRELDAIKGSDEPWRPELRKRFDTRYGDGRAAERIVSVLRSLAKKNGRTPHASD